MASGPSLSARSRRCRGQQAPCGSQARLPLTLHELGPRRLRATSTRGCSSGMADASRTSHFRLNPGVETLDPVTRRMELEVETRGLVVGRLPCVDLVVLHQGRPDPGHGRPDPIMDGCGGLAQHRWSLGVWKGWDGETGEVGGS